MSLNRVLLTNIEKEAKKEPRKKKNSDIPYFKEPDFSFLQSFQKGGPVWNPAQLAWMKQSIDNYQSNNRKSTAVIPQPNGDMRSFIKPPTPILTKKEAEEAERLRKAFDNGTIKKAEKRSKIGKAIAIAANPFTAAQYKVKGQSIPDNFDKGESNPYDIASAVINPASYLYGINQGVSDISEGNIGSGLFNLATSVPGTGYARTYLKNNPLFKEALKEGFKSKNIGNIAETMFLGIADKTLPIIAKTPGLKTAYKNIAYNLASNYHGTSTVESRDLLKDLQKYLTKGKLNHNYTGFHGYDASAQSKNLLRQYIFGDAKNFKESNLNPIGLEKYTERYGDIPVYEMSTRIPKNKNLEIDPFDSSFGKLTDKSFNKGKSLYPTTYDNEYISPAKPLDDVGGHMGYLVREQGKPWKHVTQDIWKFHPEDYKNRWSKYVEVDEHGDAVKKYDKNLASYRSYVTAKAMENAGKPFILMQEHPVKFSKMRSPNPNQIQMPSFYMADDLNDNPDLSIEEVLESLKGMKLKRDGGMIIDPMGQWKHPGKNTRIPGNSITMDGVPYPVIGKGSDGTIQMMYPNQNYNFGNSEYVDEYPLISSSMKKKMKAQVGGQIPAMYMPPTYHNPNWPTRARTTEADRSGDAMVVSPYTQNMMDIQALYDMSQKSFNQSMSSADKSAYSEQLRNTMGSINKDGDWVPNQNYFKPGRLKANPVQTNSSIASFQKGGERLWHAEWDQDPYSYIPTNSELSEDEILAARFAEDVANYPGPKVPQIKVSDDSYKGSSIVDFIKSWGYNSDFSSRKELAKVLGINNYKGTAAQNLDMLDRLQSDAGLMTNIPKDVVMTKKTHAGVKTSKKTPAAVYKDNTTYLTDKDFYLKSHPNLSSDQYDEMMNFRESATVGSGKPFSANSTPGKYTDAYFLAQMNRDKQAGLVPAGESTENQKLLREGMIDFFGKEVPLSFLPMLKYLRWGTKYYPYGQKAIEATSATRRLSEFTRGLPPMKKSGGSTWSGNAWYQNGGPVIGDEMDVTPEQLELLKKQGYKVEIL